MLFHTDLIELIKLLGYGGLFLIVFIESGVFFGFFLPGDSLLFTAGLLASQGFFNITALVVIIIIAAIFGDSAGYWFGSYLGKLLFKKEDSLFFKKKYLLEAGTFYEKYGAQAILLARFIPIVRTFVPIVAGIARMRYHIFLRYNIFGAFIWVLLLTFLGYFLGLSIPNIDKYLLPIVLGIIFVSLLPVIIQAVKKKRTY